MKKILSMFILSAVFCLIAAGQEGLYYYGPNYKIVQTKNEARTFQEVKKSSEKKYTIHTYTFQDKQWIKSMKEIIRVRGKSEQKITYYADNFFPRRISRKMTQLSPGVYMFEESNRYRTLRSGTSTRFLPLWLDGSVTEYFENGQVKSKSVYHDNQLLSNENWLDDGSKYIDSIFYSVDKEPIYHMEPDYFKHYIFTRLAESQINLEEFDDDVLIGFVIMETGEIQGVRALKGRSKELNLFLVNAIATLPGEWTPAQLNGSPVRYYMTLPMNFVQNNANFQELEMSGGILFYNRY